MLSNVLSNRRILVVEDEYFVADEMRRDLQARGAVVVGPVAFVDQALALITDEPVIDAAVLDVSLAGGEMVYPVADALVAKGAPIVFVSSYGRDLLQGAYPLAGWVLKPTKFSAVAKALMQSLMN